MRNSKKAWEIECGISQDKKGDSWASSYIPAHILDSMEMPKGRIVILVPLSILCNTKAARIAEPAFQFQDRVVLGSGTG